MFIHATPLILSYTLRWNFHQIDKIFPGFFSLGDLDDPNLFMTMYLPCILIYFVCLSILMNVCTASTFNGKDFIRVMIGPLFLLTGASLLKVVPPFAFKFLIVFHFCFFFIASFFSCLVVLII